MVLYYDRITNYIVELLREVTEEHIRRVFDDN